MAAMTLILREETRIVDNTKRSAVKLTFQTPCNRILDCLFVVFLVYLIETDYLLRAIDHLFQVDFRLDQKLDRVLQFLRRCDGR